VARARELTITCLDRRIIHGHAAHHDGTVRYLEHGQPIG
jgi:8-oxo-dGTP diphosphatase